MTIKKTTNEEGDSLSINRTHIKCDGDDTIPTNDDNCSYTTLFCKKCGHEYIPGDNFCTQCATKLKDTCNCWVKKIPFNCGCKKCPGWDLLFDELRATLEK